VENSVCKRLWACRKTDCVMMMMMMMKTCGLCLEIGNTERKQGFGMFLSLQPSSGACILVVNAVAFRPISLLRRKSVLYFSLSSLQLGYCLISPIVVLVDKLRVAQLFLKRAIYSCAICSFHTRSVIYEWIWNTCGIILTGENIKMWRKHCPSAALHTINSIRSGLVLNSGLGDEKPAGYRLSQIRPRLARQVILGFFWSLNFRWCPYLPYQFIDNVFWTVSTHLGQ